jgi:hypothetical protein
LAGKTLEAPVAGLEGVEAERDGPGVGERPAQNERMRERR